MAVIRRTMLGGWQVILWLGPPALLLSAALTYWHAQQALARDLDDDALGQSAQRIAHAADVYMRRVVNGIADIAASPQVMDLATESNRRGAIVDADCTLDHHWQTVKNGSGKEQVSSQCEGWFSRMSLSTSSVHDAEERRLTEILGSETSQYLQHLVKTAGTVLKEFALADRYGRLVAASVRTDDYLQNDDSWWPKDLEGFRSCSASPPECALYRDVSWDESANAYGMDVTLPVRDGDTLAGVLKVVVDPLELNDIARLSDGAVTVELLRRDGRELLERGTKTMFDDGNTDTPPGDQTNAVKVLVRGGETVLRRAAGNVAVRALKGPMGSYWIAVAQPAVAAAETAWRVPAAWLLLTIATLLLTAFAAAATRDHARRPVGPTVHAEPL